MQHKIKRKIAGIIRKSPTTKGVEESIKNQKLAIQNKLKIDFGDTWQEDYILIWFIDDAISGDTPERPELNVLFKRIDEFDYAYCSDVDRFSRSYLGLQWFNDYFLTERGLKPHMGCMLRFCAGVSELYDEDGLINPDAYMTFFFLCGIAQAELIKIRKRSEAGRNRLRGTPEWKKKYRGRPPGTKNKVTRINNGKRK